MKQKVKEPKVKLGRNLLPKAASDNFETLSDELFVLPFLSESLIRKQEQLMQLSHKNRSFNFPSIPSIINKSPFSSNSKILDLSKLDNNRKASLLKSQPSSAISNKSSKSSKSNLSSKYESQKPSKEFDEIDRNIAVKFRISESKSNKKFLFLTPEATVINKFQMKKQEIPKPKEIRGILKNSSVNSMDKEFNQKLDSESFKDKSFESLDYAHSYKETSPNYDISHLPKLTSPNSESNKENIKIVNNNSKPILKYEVTFSNKLLQRISQYKHTNYQIEKYINSHDFSQFENEIVNNQVPNNIQEQIMANEYKNRLSQINEESSNNSTPSLCSQWSSSFSSILSEDLLESDIFDNSCNFNPKFIKQTPKTKKQLVN